MEGISHCPYICKLNKDLSLVESYRPIALTLHVLYMENNGGNDGQNIKLLHGIQGTNNQFLKWV